jgi:hypothetical protein
MACVELLLHQVAAVCLNSASIIRYASPNVAHNPIRGNIQMNSWSANENATDKI